MTKGSPRRHCLLAALEQGQEVSPNALEEGQKT